MSRLQEFADRVESEGILQLSAGVFKDHEVTFCEKKSIRKANTTPEDYCKEMGAAHAMSAEEYANELLSFMDAPRKRIIGECDKCFAFLVENEPHTCEA